MKKKIRFEDLILYEDECILAVNKPVGVSSLADKQAQTLQGLGKTYHPDLHLCHRIDKLTSGVLLIAKNMEVYRDISLQFQHRNVSKRYQALVSGVQKFDLYEVSLPLLISTNKRVVVHMQEGKKAKTVLHSTKHFRNYTLVSCEPVTGRMHQIRVHLSAVRSPIVGDTLYGGEDIYLSQIKRNYKASGRKEERPLNHGFLLHAQCISFDHPNTKERLSIEAPLPKNFEVVLKQLGKYNL
ncbi:MAG: RluA family pseudouridine synthase [Bacteroidota bacterium]